MISVEIDSHSGFCGGVIRAVETAQERLRHGRLYSLGAIVHNEEELSRLSTLGMKTISSDNLSDIPAGSDVLIRAHGEPPSLYKKAKELNLNIIDCTCPVVLALQKSIREADSRLGANGGGQIVIFGKIGHPEVLGLVGQANSGAVVIESVAQLEKMLACGGIRTEAYTEVFSQTTMSPSEYDKVCALLESRINGRLERHDTICRQVASRHGQLKDFALSHDVIIFVAGGTSSNGKVLFDLCRQYNSRSYHIRNASELEAGFFRDGDRVGVCGATSTPEWLLRETAAAISRIAIK